jgi:hypothetical protein
MCPIKYETPWLEPDRDIPAGPLTISKADALSPQVLDKPVPCVFTNTQLKCSFLNRYDAVCLQQIVEVNGVLRQGLEKGLPITNLMENWDFLQVRAIGNPSLFSSVFTFLLVCVYLQGLFSLGFLQT